uniref:Uncharacterized protein n=1 Tax=Glossina austeni TaxID=7395 RepID=A0A1A9VWG3_GLOAU
MKITCQSQCLLKATMKKAIALLKTLIHTYIEVSIRMACSGGAKISWAHDKLVLICSDLLMLISSRSNRSVFFLFPEYLDLDMDLDFWIWKLMEDIDLITVRVVVAHTNVLISCSYIVPNLDISDYSKHALIVRAAVDSMKSFDTNSSKLFSPLTAREISHHHCTLQTRNIANDDDNHDFVADIGINIDLIPNYYEICDLYLLRGIHGPTASGALSTRPMDTAKLTTKK